MEIPDQKMRRICGLPLRKIFYFDILLCLVLFGVVYIILKAVIVHNVGGYFSSTIYHIYRIIAPICTFLALVSHVLLRRGIREQRKVYFQIHIGVRLIVGCVFFTTSFWLLISEYLPEKAVSSSHKVVQIFLLGGVFGMSCFHLWVVKLYIIEFDKMKVIGVQDNCEGMDIHSSDKESRKFLRSVTLSEKKVKINLANVLGSGQFSKVVAGEYLGKSVAIKINQIDKNLDPDFAKNILSELKLLSLVKSHPHVIKFYGATFFHSYCGIVLQHCNCSLQSYLVQIGQNLNDKKTKSVDKHELLRLSLEIAMGMEYLGVKHIVHGDLASRNVLLDEKNSAKISDFGLSLKLYYYQLYATSGHSIFPWRWMPPEALVDLKFSIQSDIWSFGVVLWEMYSLGKIPYDNVNWSSDFAQLLKGGLRLGQPELCDKNLFELMHSCWRLEPSDRISFNEILIHLNKANSLNDQATVVVL